MAFNPFIGWSQPELETELRRAQEDLSSGKVESASTAGDVSSTFQLAGSPEKRIGLILRALNLLDPVKYPLDQIVPLDRTRPTFYTPYPNVSGTL